MKKILALFFLVLVTMSCDDNDDDNFIVRLKNETGVKLENIKVVSSDEDKSFGTIEPQMYSHNESFISISNDIWMSSMIDDQLFTHLPLINIWAGHPLDPGKYTYTLYNVDTDLQSFSIQIAKD